MPALPRSRFPLVSVVLIAGLITACASLVRGNMQEVAVQTLYENRQVYGVECTLKNNNGEKTVTTPGRVLIPKSFDFMEIRCRKAGVPDGMIRVDSRTGDEIFGNILFGGLVGVGIDMGSASAYEYEHSIFVHMGKEVDRTGSNRKKTESPDP